MRKLLLAVLLATLPILVPGSGLRQICDSLEVLSGRYAVERDSAIRIADSLQTRVDSCEARAVREASVHRRLNYARQDAETRVGHLEDFNDQLLLLSAVLTVILLFAFAAIFLRRFLRAQPDKTASDTDIRIERMHKLVRLRESGILSADEAEALKQELMKGSGE
jgi:hypothetical protein